MKKTMASYKIKSGDTLSKIASKFGTTVTAIQRANPTIIKNVNVIKAGVTIQIPTSETNSEKYSELVTTLKKCIADIENLDSFKRLEKLL